MICRRKSKGVVKKVGHRMQRRARWKDEESCKMLGIENREVNGQRLKGVLTDVEANIATGKEFENTIYWSVNSGGIFRKGVFK